MGRKLLCLSLLLAFSFYFISPAEATGGAEIRELEERIDALEEGKGFRPPRADWLKIGGEVRLDLIVPQEVDSYVELDRVELEIKALIADGVYTAGTINFGVDEVEISEWYTRFSLDDHWLRVGLTDRFIAPGDMDLGSRKTAGHPLSSVAFWRDEHWNLTLGGMFPGAMGDWRYRLSFGSGLALDDRRPGDHRFDYTPDPEEPGEYIEDELFHDDDHGQRGDEFGLGLGHRFHFYPEATLDLVGFGIWSRMTAEDDEGDAFTGFPQHDNQQRLGFRIVYEAEISVPLGEAEPLLMFEYIAAEDGKLERDAWYLQASYELSLARPLIRDRFITEIEPLIRFGKYNVDVAKCFYDPLTWDREQLTLALLADIVDNVSLRIEYDINDEETGGREIDNNEFRVQLRTRW